MSQNLYTQFETPENAAKKHLKTQLFVQLTKLMADDPDPAVNIGEISDWSGAKVVQFEQGDLHEISIDDLVGIAARLGYDVEPTLVPHDNA